MSDPRLDFITSQLLLYLGPFQGAEEKKFHQQLQNDGSVSNFLNEPNVMLIVASTYKDADSVENLSLYLSLSLSIYIYIYINHLYTSIEITFISILKNNVINIYLFVFRTSWY